MKVSFLRVLLETELDEASLITLPKNTTSSFQWFVMLVEAELLYMIKS